MLRLTLRPPGSQSVSARCLRIATAQSGIMTYLRGRRDFGAPNPRCEPPFLPCPNNSHSLCLEINITNLGGFGFTNAASCHHHERHHRLAIVVHHLIEATPFVAAENMFFFVDLIFR